MDVTRRISGAFSFRRAFSAIRQETLVVPVVLAILAVALGLRLYGLNWDAGFDWTPHPDERAILAKTAELSPPSLGNPGVLFDAERSPWNPRWFPYGSLPLYLLRGAQILSSGAFGGESGDLRPLGRAISALADVTTVLIIYALGSRAYGRRVGLLASALAALAVIHIQLSHFFAVDTLLALFTVVSIYFMYRVAKEGRLSDSIWAGVFIGLGLATKVSLGPIYAAFFVAHLMRVLSAIRDADSAPAPFSRRFSSAITGAAAGIGVSLAIFFVAQPYALLDWSRFYADVSEQYEMVNRIRDYPYTRQYIDTTPYLYQIRQLAAWGLGWPLGIVAWAGLLYASLRGMRLRYGLTYLVIGWGVPIAILATLTGFLAVAAASGIALLALLGTLLVRSPSSRVDVLLLSWVVPYLLITGALQVKFLRYLIPLTPFLLLFGSQMLFALWDRLAAIRPGLQPWIVAGLTTLVCATAFYALSYAGVYGQTHTAVRASDWIRLNAPEESVILKEHWEEALPGLYGYEIRELPMYDNDDARKLHRIAEELAGADYMVLFSNRLYGTVSRLPERYPISREYYRLLFSGRLGYRVVDFETAYPSLLGVSFVDDTFSRPDLPEPAALSGRRESPLTLDLGFADESFSVYDHPKVIVFENVERLSEDALRSLFDGVAAPELAPRPRQADDVTLGLMLTAEDAAAQQRGGTWTSIILPDSWTSRFPVLAWLIVLQGISLLALPVTLLLFRPLPDRGYLFAKALGLLTVCLVVWLLASLRWMAFSPGSISLAVLLLALVSAVAVARRRRELASFVRERWRGLAIMEVVFLVAFFVFLAIRMANPDLWHPFRGGEKPMDLAYLGAVLRSSYMPPFDPWFGGGYINYYYWGQFIVAMFIKATGIQPTVAFNLAVPTFFALTIGGAFSVVYNLAESTRRGLIGSFPLIGSARTTELGSSSTMWELARRRAREQGISHAQPATGASMHRDPLRPGHPHPDLPRPSGKGLSPLLAGICGALFVAVLGNLDGAAQVGHGVWRAVVQNAPFGAFDFWRSSRMMAPDPPGHEITEFPFFTFLFADLHAHMMAIPFTLLSIGLSLALVLAAPRRAAARSHWGGGEIATLAVLGVVVGSLRLINAWDFPTYLLIGAASVFLAEFLVQGGLGTAMLARAVVKSALVFAVGYLAFLPFHLTYETFVSGVESTTNTTVLWQFLAISGLFVFIIVTFFIRESGDLLVSVSRRSEPLGRPCGPGGLGRRRGRAWSKRLERVGAYDWRSAHRLRVDGRALRRWRQHSPVRGGADGARADRGVQMAFAASSRHASPGVRRAPRVRLPGIGRCAGLPARRKRHRAHEQRVQVLPPGLGVDRAGVGLSALVHA